MRLLDREATASVLQGTLLPGARASAESKLRMLSHEGCLTGASV